MNKQTFERNIKIGNQGETLIYNMLISNGFMVYPHPKVAHPIDFLVVRRDIGLFAVEVKTKPKMRKYDATGIDYAHYAVYKWFNDEYCPVFIAFVDYEMDRVYGNYLNELIKPITVDGFKYPFHNEITQMISFPIKNTKTVLKSISQNSYNLDVSSLKR